MNDFIRITNDLIVKKENILSISFDTPATELLEIEDAVTVTLNHPYNRIFIKNGNSDLKAMSFTSYTCQIKQLTLEFKDYIKKITNKEEK